MKVTVITGNGLGGTEKAAFIYAAELSQRGHQVCAITTKLGPRSSTLIEAGVEIHDIPYEVDPIKEHLEQFSPDIVHQHVPGYGDHRALYDALDQHDGKRPKLIETNVFGRLMDRHDKGHVSFRLFISMANGSQAFQRPRLTSDIPTPEKHAVLSYPMPDYVPPSAERRREVRQQLGIGDADVLWIRLGRPVAKWAHWDCEAFATSRMTNSRLKLLLMEPPPQLASAIREGRWGDGIQIRPATSDFSYLSDLYGSADGMIHASNFGESFGYTLAEAMQAGLPIVTMSTPWGDNAQVQLVGQNENGFVCCSTRGMAAAVNEISTNPALAVRMAGVAKARIAEISDRSRDVDLLEEIMLFVTGGPLGPLMRERFAEWMNYRNHSFQSAQNHLYERDNGMALPVIRWKAYCMYRSVRASARHKIDSARVKLHPKSV